MIIVTHLRSFQALELALRTGSLKQAAEMLSITPAALGQRIKTLEDYLGIDLIVRSRSGIQPTIALSRAIPHLNKAFLELREAAAALDFQRVNEIHIAADPDWADLWLWPRLEQFRAQNPNLLFCVNGEGDVPVRLGRADVEVSFQHWREADNHSLLFHDFMIPISSAGNAERIGRTRRNRLEGFPLIHLDFYRNDPAAIDWPRWIGLHGHRKTAGQGGIRFRRIAPAVDAIEFGAGLMLCGLALILDRIEAGRLVMPFPASTGVWTRWAFQARFRQDALLRPQLVHFRDWLAGEARATEARVQAIAGSAP